MILFLIPHLSHRMMACLTVAGTAFSNVKVSVLIRTTPLQTYVFKPPLPRNPFSM